MRNFFLLINLTACIFSGCNSSNSSIEIPATEYSEDLPSKIKLVTDSDPGEPMIISGIIYLPGGKTPAKDVLLSLWQTDATGLYNHVRSDSAEFYPRLHGKLKTGSDGKYEFHTIRPAQYPGHSNPAHIHGHISAPDFPEYPVIYYFEGDDLINDNNRSKYDNHRGGTPSIITLTKNSNGVLIGHRDFILEYVKPSGETMKLYW